MAHPPKTQVSLSQEQRSFLIQATKKGAWSPREVQRANILLLADINGPDALSDDVIASQLRCSIVNVALRRRRFAQVNTIEEAILDKSRSGRPTIVEGAIEAHMTTIACTTPPEGRARWTLELIRNRLVKLEVIDQISCMTVGRVLKKKSSSRG